MIEIDGSYEEGGGQMVRTALACSVLTQQAFIVEDIRRGRPVSGLKAQHLTAIKALRQICDARSTEVVLGSTRLEFHPGPVRAGQYVIDIGTAGSITLLLQALLLPLLFGPGPTQLKIRGGTSGLWQASVEFMIHILFPYLSRLGTIDVLGFKRGYYPKGGGELELRIRPRFPDWRALTAVPPYRLTEKGALVSVSGVSHAAASLQEARVAERQAEAAQKVIAPLFSSIQLETVYESTRSAGSGICLWAHWEHPTPQPELPHLIMGAEKVGEKGVRAEHIGKEAGRLLLQEIRSPAPVDEYLADQLLPFLALLPGSVMQVPEMTGHVLSNIYVLEKFLPIRFERQKNRMIVRKE